MPDIEALARALYESDYAGHRINVGSPLPREPMFDWETGDAPVMDRLRERARRMARVAVEFLGVA